MKIFLSIVLLTTSLFGFSQSSTRGALVTIDTSTFSNSAGFIRPTIKMLAVNRLDNAVVYWDLNSWSTVAAGGSGSVPISSLLSATVSNAIDNGSMAQVWGWNKLGESGGNVQGLYLYSTSTTTESGSDLLFTQVQGAHVNPNIQTRAATFDNHHTGTNSTNIAIYAQAYDGTNNYAIIVPPSSGSVGIGNSTPAPSAILDVASTTQGFLPPRMTATQASAISSPAQGLMIFVTSTNGTFTSIGWWGYGTSWKLILAQ